MARKDKNLETTVGYLIAELRRNDSALDKAEFTRTAAIFDEPRLRSDVFQPGQFVG
jgi:hypothetical protein